MWPKKRKLLVVSNAVDVEIDRNRFFCKKTPESPMLTKQKRKEKKRIKMSVGNSLVALVVFGRGKALASLCVLLGVFPRSLCVESTVLTMELAAILFTCSREDQNPLLLNNSIAQSFFLMWRLCIL